MRQSADDPDDRGEPDAGGCRQTQCHGTILLVDDDARAEKPDACDKALNYAADVASTVGRGKVVAGDDKPRGPAGDNPKRLAPARFAMQIAVKPNRSVRQNRDTQSHQDFQV